MPGLLDILMGNNGAVSPYSALYPSPLLGQMPTATGQAPDASTAAAYGAMGIDPSAFALPTPPVSPFPQQPEAPKAPDLGTFGKGAVPFGFAGPGSLGAAPSVLGPAAPAAPMPAPAPAVAQAPAAPPTDASSVNRSQAPDDFIPVGDYQMPAFRGRGAPMDAQAAAPAPAAPAPAPAAAPAAPTAPAVAPFSLGGAGDRFGMATRGLIGNMHNGPIGAILGGLGAAITGQETDPGSITRQKANASAQALVSKGASQAEAAAAINNPALMSALIQQYYGKDKWNVVQVGEDDRGKVFMQQNQIDGTLRDIPRRGAAGSGAADTVTGPDGKPIQIPPGVDRKEFIKQVTHANADAATGKQTEAQAKSAAYAARMQKAQDDLGKLQNEGLDAVQAVSSSVPLVGNYLQTGTHQQYETAKSAFISAKLRAESGAAISPSEYKREEKELFPQPGDTPERVQQKAGLRAAALEEMKRSAGPGYRSRAATPAAAPTAAPKGSVNVGGQTINWSVN